MIRVATDSTANLPQDLMAELNIAMIPSNIHFGKETVLDGVEITTAQFYKRLAASPELPTTSQLSVKEYVKFYQDLIAESPGATILSLHISAALSGTIESARQAAAQLPDIKIFIFDTKSVGMGHGLMVHEAGRMARAGATMEEILTRLSDMRRRMRSYWALDTLDYLAKSGRIGRAARLLGTLLNMKPILTLKDGMIDAYDRQLSRERAVRTLIDLAVKDGKGKPGLQLSVIHSACETECQLLAENLRKELEPEVLIVAEVGAAVGVYVGPGTLGVVWWYPEGAKQ